MEESIRNSPINIAHLWIYKHAEQQRVEKTISKVIRNSPNNTLPSKEEFANFSEELIRVRRKNADFRSSDCGGYRNIPLRMVDNWIWLEPNQSKNIKLTFLNPDLETIADTKAGRPASEGLRQRVTEFAWCSSRSRDWFEALVLRKSVLGFRGREVDSIVSHEQALVFIASSDTHYVLCSRGGLLGVSVINLSINIDIESMWCVWFVNSVAMGVVYYEIRD